MSSSFAVPKSLDKPIERLDQLFAQAFSSDSPAMQDWVTIRFALKAAQPHENKERAENSPASPEQKLKAEIAALVTEFGVYAKEYEPSDNYCDLLERLRQLSAV